MHMWRYGLLVVSIVVFTGCQVIGSRETEAEAQSAAPPRNPLEITAGALLLEQIKVGELGWAEVSESFRVPARVEVDDTRMARIGAPIAGRVIEVFVYEGQTVKRGQVLAKLYSADLAEVQLEFLKAHSQRQLAERAVARAQQLFKAAVIGSADLERREAEFAQTAAEVAAARRQLEVLGMPEGSIQELEKTHVLNPTTQIVASMSGTILERKITIGQVVQPAETVVVVADLSHVWLVADVPEQSAGSLQRGHAAQAEIPALPGVPISGELSFVSPTVNPETRTVRVRMDLLNPQGRFKPAMLATMTLQGKAVRQPVVPSSAVVREENQDHVFVQLDQDTFVLRPVELGFEFHHQRVLLSGLQPGEKIVVDGAFHLNNERKREVVQGV
ncbi:MAG TPA: efflux RND transporter periplasmic adaptor subunit [Methylomirabilota bacterium]|nr:efflux RND transporter periplasmic adaptor subunit [Methylomirabilota bacterium]